MSPIKGISEIVRLPKLGKIRLGIKKEGSDESIYPEPTDYFVCPDEVKKVFGEKPKQLSIMFPTENSKQWASQYLRRYSAARNLICRGDGEVAIARVYNSPGDTGSGRYFSWELKEIVCNPRNCPYYQADDCRRVMNLQFLLPDCPGFGVYQLDTSSYHSMTKVNSMLTFLRGICSRVSMIPLTLELIPEDVHPEGWLKTAYVLRLTSYHSVVEIRRFAQMPRAGVLSFPPPDSEAPDDLFPDRPVATGERAQIPCGPAETLFSLWTKAKSKIMHFDIQNSQIANWFEKNWRLTVTLDDFEPPAPPEKFTVETLRAFCESVDRHVGQ